MGIIDRRMLVQPSAELRDGIENRSLSKVIDLRFLVEKQCVSGQRTSAIRLMGHRN
jgi:hypothetical protein